MDTHQLQSTLTRNELPGRRRMNPYARPDVGPMDHHRHQHHQHQHHQHHQRLRYAPVPSSFLYPNLPSFSDNPNLHAIQTLDHYHHHPQSRYLPPPIQHPSPPVYHASPASLRQPTAPLSPYGLSSRGFNLVDDDGDRGSSQPYHHHHHALVDSDSRVIRGHDSLVGGNRAKFLERHQTISHNLVRRSYSNANLDNNLHYRVVEHMDASSYGSVDCSRPDSRTISRARLREDNGEEFNYNQLHDLLRGPPRRLASVPGSSDNEPHRSERGDITTGNNSWVHNREITRELIRDYGKDFGSFTTDLECYGSDYERYNSVNRGSGEFGVYSIAPKKQPQKKSAFLRLQMPRFSRRNRENEQHYSSNYHDDNAYGSPSFKGKGQGQFNYSDLGSKDKGECSSVDLEVSFKSNTLVGKTVIPQSSYRAASEKDSIPLSKKLKSAIVSEKASANFSLDKQNQNDEKLNSSSDVGAAIGITKKAKKLCERVDAQLKGNLGQPERIIIESAPPVHSECSPSSVSQMANVSSSTSEVRMCAINLVVDKAGNDIKSCKDAMGAAISSSKNSRQLHKRVDRSEPQQKDTLEHLKGIVNESDDPFKLGSSKVSSSISEVGKYNLSFDDANVCIDLQCHRGVSDGEDSKGDSKIDMVFDGVCNKVGSTQGDIAGKELSGKALSIKDAVPDGQGSTVPKIDVSANDGRSNDLGQDKTAQEILPDEAHLFKHAVPEEQYSSAGAKRAKSVVVSDKKGKNGSSIRRTAEQMLADKTPVLKVANNKIVKKVIKKVVTCGSVPLKKRTSGKRGESVKAGSYTASASPGGSGFLRKEIELCHVANQDSNEIDILLQTGQTKGASHSISSEVYGKDTDGGTDAVCREKHVDCLSSPSCSIFCEETITDPPDATNFHQIVLNPINDIAVSFAQAVPEIKMDVIGGGLSEDAICLLPENQSGKVHFARDSISTCPSNSGCFNFLDGCTDIGKSSLKEKTAFCAEEVSGDLPIVSCKVSNGAAECNKSQVHRLTAELSEDTENINTASGYWFSGSHTISEQNLIYLARIVSNDAMRQLSHVEDPIELDIGSKENLQNFVSTVEDCASNAGRCTDRISQVDHLSSKEDGIYSKSMDVTSSPSHIENVVLNSSMKDPDLAVPTSLPGLTSELLTAPSDLKLNSSNGRESKDAVLPSDANILVNIGNDSGDNRISHVPTKMGKVFSPNRGSSEATVPQNDGIVLDVDAAASIIFMQRISSDSSIKPEVGGMGLTSDVLQGPASLSSQEETSVFLKDNRHLGYPNVIVSSGNDEFSGFPTGSYLGQSVTASGQSLTRLITEGMPEESFPTVTLMHQENPATNHERSRARELDLHPSEKQVMSECDRLKLSNMEIDFHLSDQKASNSNVKDDAGLNLKDEPPPVSPYLSLYTDINTVYGSKSNDEIMEFMPDLLSDRDLPENLQNVCNTKISVSRAFSSPLADEGVAKNNNADTGENVVVRGSSTSADSALTSPSHNNLVDYSSDHAVGTRCSARNKTVNFPSNDLKGMGCSWKPSSPEPYGGMNRKSHLVQRSFPGHASFTATNSKITSSNSTSNTWRRKNAPSHAAPVHKPPLGNVQAKRNLPENIEKVQNTSYIRKGNSLVRKPVVAAPQTQLSHGTIPFYKLNSSDLHDLKKSTFCGHDDGINSMSTHLRTDGRKTSMAKPQMLPQCSIDDLPGGSSVPSASLLSFQAARLPVSVSSDQVLDTTGSVDKDVLEMCEDARVSSEIHQKENESFKQMTYVKHSINQLVSTVNDPDLPVHMIDKPQCLPSKGYYKRKKNQLIRTSLQAAEKTLSNNVRMEAPHGINGIFSARRGTRKVAAKSCTPLTYPSAWNSCGTPGGFNASNGEKFYPYYFPSKRITYWQKFKGKSAPLGDNRSLSAISRRLMLLRKRETVYVRSSHGFSLRKSKVVSVSGRSLKWSKSMERRTKEASEEATRAVAAVVKEKIQQKVTKSRSRSPRGRIFRIGNIRYRMDATRNSLIRISDEESSLSVASQRGTDVKKSYVPRRLVIGNDEYVRIGNGNQLVRNLKKRSRVLANEKVKWSLHTARLKLAKKRTYCQFFTRFGKCNKGDGKCPYIHDPSKIAVCTKFLSGSCSNEECKLTHKVIPERMPDCSYFLQGLCTNRNCPYRHVNVNPNSSTCEGFLRGYCADGDECQKKHSYVCPIYESTGNCHLGSKCKLHHPKCHNKGKKRKRSKENTMGRYFGGSTRAQPSGPKASSTEKLYRDYNNIRDGDKNLVEGSFSDYIALGYTDEEDEGEVSGEIVHAMGDDTSDDADMEVDDIYSLIKPFGIMDVKA
ncbi:hypothetical protein SAY87_007532 [Trapa incisa]|uniref:C3H1-type domain-containing protein n=1 Tax=Trapa incisa TaxID=236973 RepID=A0AAN7QID0_9MYRT|nr:hypothetical protein SAY87_007532 [Trapa incisa]